jgi:hypothetical protein
VLAVTGETESFEQPELFRDDRDVAPPDDETAVEPLAADTVVDSLVDDHEIGDDNVTEADGGDEIDGGGDEIGDDGGDVTEDDDPDDTVA